MIDGPQPISVDDGHAGAAPGGRRTPTRFYGLEIDPDREVMVTSGATEALADCLIGADRAGRRGGADRAALRQLSADRALRGRRCRGWCASSRPTGGCRAPSSAAAFGPQDQGVLLNTPMNPTGKVFTADELAFIAELLERRRLCGLRRGLRASDLTRRRHIPLMTLPGMRERCLRIGSAGKTFSLTGWKVGYVTGPPDTARSRWPRRTKTSPSPRRPICSGRWP